MPGELSWTQKTMPGELSWTQKRMPGELSWKKKNAMCAIMGMNEINVSLHGSSL